MPKMIQIRNVPDDVHGEIKARAARAGMSLSDYLLREVRRLVEVPSLEEVLAERERWTRPTVAESPAEAVAAERRAR